MTSNTNTFRLQRLTKTVGIREKSHSEYEPKETFKLAALNSINRGIKYNDLSMMSGRDLNKLRKEPEIGEDIQYESAHVNLSQVRKNYDSVHKDKTKRDDSIIKLKEEKNKLNIIEGELLENKEKGRKKVTDLQNTLQTTKLLFTESDMQKKVLLSMRLRLKNDKVTYDQRKFDLEKQLKFLKTQQSVIITDKTDICENDDRTNKVYKKYLQQLKAEQAQREEHLSNLQSMIDEKSRVNHLNLLRSQEMTEIAERAMQDKDENQLKWEKLYYTNKFVAKLLRDKMDKQMSKFFVVESAFKTIKISTGVSDAETLVSKFLNKQTAYGDLLGKIAENEKRILELKRQRDELVQEEKELEDQKQIIDSTKRVIPSIDAEMKKMKSIEARQKTIVLKKNNMRSWLSKIIKKTNTLAAKNIAVSNERDLKSISTGFVEFLKNISEELDVIKAEQEVQENTFSDKDRIKPNNKVVRVKQNEDVFDESDEEGVNTEETNMIGDQRMQIHHGNQKFMKEIRIKYEEKRKAIAQAAFPKKKAEPEKVKQPQNDD